MIKTDEVVYRTRTQEEYNWLMDKLEKARCRWGSGSLPTEINYWVRNFAETCICLNDKRMMHSGFAFFKAESDYKDYEFIEVSDLMKNEEKENLIKTDSVIYHTETQKEYDWLTEKLEAAGCKCNVSQIPPTKMDGWQDYGSETGLQVLKNVIWHLNFVGEIGDIDTKDYEFIEVSELMENEKITANELIEQEDKQRKIKKIVYTTEVYFE